MMDWGNKHVIQSGDCTVPGVRWMIIIGFEPDPRNTGYLVRIWRPATGEVIFQHSEPVSYEQALGDKTRALFELEEIERRRS